MSLLTNIVTYTGTHSLRPHSKVFKTYNFFILLSVWVDSETSRRDFFVRINFGNFVFKFFHHFLTDQTFQRLWAEHFLFGHLAFAWKNGKFEKISSNEEEACLIMYKQIKRFIILLLLLLQAYNNNNTTKFFKQKILVSIPNEHFLHALFHDVHGCKGPFK